MKKTTRRLSLNKETLRNAQLFKVSAGSDSNGPHSNNPLCVEGCTGTGGGGGNPQNPASAACSAVDTACTCHGSLNCM
jgi:hypothetical protein